MVKRSIYLINPKFQLKLALFVCTFVFLPSLIYPYTIYEIINRLLVKYGPIHNQMTVLEDQKITLVTILVIIQIAITGIVFVITIFQGHKIAGPLYKLHTFMRRIVDGNMPEKLYFRKGDNFHELAADFNDLVDKLNEQQHRDFKYISDICAYLNNLSLIVPEDKRPVINEIISKLTEIQDRYKPC